MTLVCSPPPHSQLQQHRFEQRALMRFRQVVFFPRLRIENLDLVALVIGWQKFAAMLN